MVKYTQESIAELREQIKQSNTQKDKKTNVMWLSEGRSIAFEVLDDTFTIIPKGEKGFSGELDKFGSNQMWVINHNDNRKTILQLNKGGASAVFESALENELDPLDLKGVSFTMYRKTRYDYDVTCKKGAVVHDDASPEGSSEATGVQVEEIIATTIADNPEWSPKQIRAWVNTELEEEGLVIDGDTLKKAIVTALN